MAWISQAVGAALGTVGTIAANISADKTRSELLKKTYDDPKYQTSEYTKSRFALAQQLLNARMPGVASAERNIGQTQANVQGNINRNATDSSQVLALAAANQGQTNQAYGQLDQQEAADYYNRLGNYNQQSTAMSEENQRMYEDSVRRWQDQVNIMLARHGLRQQQGQNLSNLGGMIAGMGGMGGGGAAGGAAAKGGK